MCPPALDSLPCLRVSPLGFPDLVARGRTTAEIRGCHRTPSLRLSRLQPLQRLPAARLPTNPRSPCCFCRPPLIRFHHLSRLRHLSPPPPTASTSRLHPPAFVALIVDRTTSPLHSRTRPASRPARSRRHPNSRTEVAATREIELQDLRVHRPHESKRILCNEKSQLQSLPVHRSGPTSPDRSTRSAATRPAGQVLPPAPSIGVNVLQPATSGSLT